MFKLEGKFTEAKVFSGKRQESAVKQIEELLNQPFMEGLKVRIMPDYHAGKGCVIGTTIRVKDKVVPNLVGVDIGCLDRDTEYLTPDGWKKIGEYKEGEEVLQYNKDTDEANFVKPLKYIKKDCEEFIHFKNKKGLDQMLSEEHKMLIWKGFKGKGYNLEDFRADEMEKMGNKLDNGYYGVKTTFKIANKGVDLEEDEIRLDIMIAADGSIKNKRDGENLIYLHLKRERKIKRAKELLDRNNIEYKETIGKDKSTHMYFYVKDKFNKDLSRYWKANQEQLSVVADECFLWDGHIGRHRAFSSTVEEMSDIVQFALATTGVRAGIVKVDYERKNWKPIYQLTATKNEVIGVTNTIERVKSEDGKKYCFTVPTGYFVARRNGRVFITGNCGIYTMVLDVEEVDYAKLDKVIRAYVPSGFNTHEEVSGGRDIKGLNSGDFRAKVLTDEGINKGLGTLGGGNHFIELSKDDEGKYYLTVHTGSRSVGAKVASYYQKKAVEGLSKQDVQGLVERLKSEGRFTEIEGAIKELKKSTPVIPKELAYVEGKELEDYLHDIQLAQTYAYLNRHFILNAIVEKMGWGEKVVETFDTVHNYIDVISMILRKGAVSAKKGEKLIIPINMRDGSLICVGKGNPDWNYSAPHGAGRVLSRTKAKEQLSMEEFKEGMSNVWTTSVSEETLDEAPGAYKTMDEIIENIGDTVDIVKVIRPVYNFKASDL